MKPYLECLESRLTPTALIDHGGPVLSHVQLTNIYAGSGGSVLDALAAVSATDYVALAAPYGVASGAYLGSVTVPNPGAISNADVQALLTKEIASGAVAPSGPNSLYMVCLPAPVTDAFAQSYVSYHSWFLLPSGQPVVYGVVWPSIVGTLGYSHEVVEAATDPFLNAWYGAGGTAQECADLYAWQSFVLDGQTVSQFAVPDGSAAGKSTPAPPPTTSPAAPSPLGNVFVLAIEKLQEDMFGLLVHFSPVFAPQAAAAAQAVTADPLHGTTQGQMVEMQVDAVFAAWVSGQE